MRKKIKFSASWYYAVCCELYSILGCFALEVTYGLIRQINIDMHISWLKCSIAANCFYIDFIQIASTVNVFLVGKQRGKNNKSPYVVDQMTFCDFCYWQVRKLDEFLQYLVSFCSLYFLIMIIFISALYGARVVFQKCMLLNFSALIYNAGKQAASHLIQYL